MHNGVYYPRMVAYPKLADGKPDPRGEKRIPSEDIHITFNPADHADFLKELEGKPTPEALANAQQIAMGNETERCAQLAEQFGTEEGQRIADAIRGVSIHEKSVSKPAEVKPQQPAAKPTQVIPPAAPAVPPAVTGDPLA